MNLASLLVISANFAIRFCARKHGELHQSENSLSTHKSLKVSKLAVLNIAINCMWCTVDLWLSSCLWSRETSHKFLQQPYKRGEKKIATIEVMTISLIHETKIRTKFESITRHNQAISRMQIDFPSFRSLGTHRSDTTPRRRTNHLLINSVPDRWN